MVEGFENTEVGMIPSDWEVKPFSDIADNRIKWSITGGPFGSNLKVSDFTNEGVRIIQLQNIGDGEFHNDYKIFTSKEKANQLLSCNIYPNEIILSKMGDPVARACIVPDEDKRYLMASDGIRLVVNEREYNKFFVLYYINSDYFRRRAFEVSKGSTRLRIGLPQLKDLRVIKPALAEQTAIATALSDADALINQLEQLLTKKRNIKKGAMQELLKPKEGWEVKKLGEIGAFNKGKGVTKEDVASEGIACVRYGELYTHHNEYIKKIYSYITQSTAKQSYRINIGDILFAGSGETKQEIGKCAAYISDEEAYAGGDIIVFTPRNCDSLYLGYLLNHSMIARQKAQNGQGDAVVHIYPNALSRILISLPPTKSEQTRIAQILFDMDNEIGELEKQVEKYKMLKQGMMQSLLTGKIRLV